MNHALQNEDVELWHVEVAPNDVRVVTLEQLDEAFQQGLVNEKTRVFQDGMDEPALLGELLGLGDSEDEEQEEQEEDEPAVAAAPAPLPSRNHQNTLVGLAAEPPRAPVARASAPAPQSQQRPRASAPPPWTQPTEQSHARPVQSAPPAARPQSVAPQQSAQSYRQQSAPPAAAVTRRPPAPEGAWPPVVTRSAPPASVSNPSTISAVVGPVAPSVVPMAMDLGDLDDLDYPRPKRGKGKVVMATFGVLAVAAGVALGVTGRGASLVSSLSASAAQPATVAKPAPKVDTVSHAYDPGNAPVKLKDTPDPVVITTRENESTQLAAAGMTAGAAAEVASPKTAPAAKSTASKKIAVSSKRAKSSGGAAPSRHGGGGKQPFKTGGDTHDPLNGSL
ncbi:MAG TPA: hypothetical protein VH062_27435 [Polyangiaceae bacterium]|jgi:hypothetical protein|nr:hypothetical protein [Polyangiaceae bacterium]